MLSTIFRLVFTVCALLAATLAFLIVASVPLADKSGQMIDSLGISAIVGLVFLVAGALIVGIGYSASTLRHKLTEERGQTDQRALANRLVAYLAVAFALISLCLLAMLFGVIGRIMQGFAVFG